MCACSGYNGDCQCRRRNLVITLFVVLALMYALKVGRK